MEAWPAYIMKRIWLIKILYYLFFTAIICMAVMIFLDIMNFSFYEQHMAVFFRRLINSFDF